MTASSISQYLDQKRIVRPVEWATAKRDVATAGKPRSAIDAYESHGRDSAPFRRSSLLGAAALPESPPEIEDGEEDVAAELKSGRRGAGILRIREAPPAPDVDAQLSEAYHRGVQEGIDAARNEAAAARAMERAELQKRAVVEKLDFQMNEYAKLVDAVAQGIAEMERRIAGVVTNVLRPFLSEALSRQAVDELAAHIVKLTSAGRAPLMKIRGPERLLNRLKIRLTSLAVEVEFAETPGIEVVVEAQETSISSEIAPWAALLASFN